MSYKEYHVTKDHNQWQLKGVKAEKAIKTFNTKQESIDYSVQIAKNQKAELVIHKEDGTIQDKRSYGNDPYPPRD